MIINIITVGYQFLKHDTFFEIPKYRDDNDISEINIDMNTRHMI